MLYTWTNFMSPFYKRQNEQILFYNVSMYDANEYVQGKTISRSFT